eukprot:4062962-Heterocapsa_arctica.AAC.1
MKATGAQPMLVTSQHRSTTRNSKKKKSVVLDGKTSESRQSKQQDRNLQNQRPRESPYKSRHVWNLRTGRESLFCRDGRDRGE